VSFPTGDLGENVSAANLGENVSAANSLDYILKTNRWE